MMYCVRPLTIVSAALLGAMLLAQPVWAESSAEYLAEAQAYLKQGKVNAAIIQLKNALKQDPKNAEARLILGKVYLHRGDGAGAEKELTRARRLGVGMDRLATPLGRAYLMQGKADEALKEIVSEAAYPDAVKAKIITVHANAYLQQNRPEQAEKAFREALALQPEAVGALLGMGRLAIARQQFEQAAEMADKALAIRPKSAEAWAIKGEVDRLRGEFTAADAAFDKALALTPQFLPAMLGSAGANLALGHVEKADKVIDQILRLSPNQPMGNYLHAVSLYRKGDLDAAAEALQKLLKMMPDHLPSQQMMGAIDFAKRRFEQADYALSRVVEMQPGNIPAVKLLAATRLQLGQNEKVVGLLEAARAQAPNDSQLLALLGTAYLRNGQNDEGVKALEQAAEIDPEAAGVRTQLALGHLVSGETSQAVKELETAVDLGKNVFQAEAMLTLVYLRKQDFEQALKQAKAFAKRSPDSPLPLNLAGAAYLGLGETEEARKAFEQAVAKDPGFAPARINLGRLDEKAGNLAAAEQAYKAVLKKAPKHIGALMSLSRLAAGRGDEKAALQFLQSAWEGNDGALQPGLALVDYYNGKQQALRAVSIARELKSQHPEDPRVLNALGLSQLKAKDYHGAKANFEILLRLTPDSPQPYYLLGVTEQALEHPQAARQDYKKALALAEDHLSSQLALAGLEAKEKHFKDALLIARQIQQQRPDEDTGYHLEGDILMWQGKPAAAAKIYARGLKKAQTSRLVLALYSARKKVGQLHPYAPLEDWLKVHPEDVSVRLALAGALQEAGDPAAAMSLYKQLLKERPKDIVILNNLAWVAQQLGQADALDYAEQAHRLAPDNPAITDTLGWLLVKGNDLQRGIGLLQQAVGKAPHLAEIRYHLGVGLYRAGRKAEAKAELKRALDMEKDFSGADEARALLGSLQ